mgnify:CR=1 FL=1
MLITRKQFEERLNKKAPPKDDEPWIIAGRLRLTYREKNQYGTALRTYDPIKFDVLFNEWARKHK